MDFKDSIRQLSDRVLKLKDSIQTEEATKNAFIMPFINALGYDVFNPIEVIPEMVCDIGAKKGEKIDYAIVKDGVPILLIECKHWRQDLNLHDNQLLRYFNVSKAKFGLLTNGVLYRFYTDLLEPNKMDEKPFLEIDITNVKESQINELKKFHKSYFDVNLIMSSASCLKYTGELKQAFTKEFNEPSPDFIRYFTKQVYDGAVTAKVLEQFTGMVKSSLTSYVNDLISDRLKSALEVEQQKDEKEDCGCRVDNKIITTEEEKEAYTIVKSICREKLDVSRLSYKDTRDYLSVILDGNRNKYICRFYFNYLNKYIITLDENKKEIKHPISSLDDIYKISEDIFRSINMQEGAR